jgi:hypothetical protein
VLRAGIDLARVKPVFAAGEFPDHGNDHIECYPAINRRRRRRPVGPRRRWGAPGLSSRSSTSASDSLLSRHSLPREIFHF